ncbi:MAG: peptide-methionine (S)-S-oxide reductase MsrA [Planctomycetota bacterium]
MTTTLLRTLLVGSLLLTALACGGQDDAEPTTSAQNASPSGAAAPETPAEKTAAARAETDPKTETPAVSDDKPRRELATFGAGCFWCVEAVYQQIEGVVKVESGYMGGHVDNPTYEQVCGKHTGHAEVCQLTFDPDVVSYDELLDWFWRLHDPTTLNRQGADTGPQYRSAIFYHSEEQRETAERSKKAVAPTFAPREIVTEITPASTFWKAEGYHQNYYSQNKNQGYCRMVIRPKLEKLKLDH